MADRYLTLRNRYRPEKLRLAIIGESPPASGLYLYDEAGKSSEVLFAALMQASGLARPATKMPGLLHLQEKGWLVVDATYRPVDKLADAEADAIIVEDYPILRDDLRRLAPERVVLIKVNVCRLLEPKLIADGFNVLNRGRSIRFPGTGNWAHFQQQFKDVVEL